MGAEIELTEKELIIRNGRLRGGEVDSHRDHRVAMALCIAGLMAEGETVVEGVETATISYPGFDTALEDLGAKVSYEGRDDD